jgi:hypothetical protein
MEAGGHGDRIDPEGRVLGSRGRWRVREPSRPSPARGAAADLGRSWVTGSDAHDGERDAGIFTRFEPLGPTAANSGAGFEAALYDRRVQLHLESQRHPPTFIVGRRGSGKTALLLSRELEKDTLTVRLSTSEAFSQINSALDYFDERIVVTVESAAELWDAILWGPIAVRLAGSKTSRDPRDQQRVLWEGTKELRKVAAGAARPDDAVLGAMADLVVEAMIDTEGLVTVETVIDRIALGDHSWRAVREAAMKILRERRVACFVLIDSLENVGEHIDRLKLTLQGLFHLVGAKRSERSVGNFRIQCCFPSELWPSLNEMSSNPIKDFAGRMALQWHWKDLLHASSTRLAAFLQQEYPEDYKRMRSDSALELFYEFFPDTVVNQNGGTERAIAYILRHTQLLPRQVLLILNEALAQAIADSTPELPSVTGEHILASVRRAEGILCPEIFSAHHYRFPDAEQVATALIPFLPFRFDESELEQACTRAGLKKTHGHNVTAIRSMLGDIGIIGRFLGVTDVYNKAEFSYSVEGRLTLSPFDQFCLHPLFVRQFGSVSLLDRDSFAPESHLPVYPMGTPGA